MAQVRGSLSGNWWISYADSEGLKALCWALKLVSDLEENAERSDYYSAAAERLGMDDLARCVGEVLTFQHIRFFAGDLYQNKRLVYFWRDNGAYDCPPVDRTTSICRNIDLSRSDGLHAIFARWFDHWVNGSVGPLPDETGEAVAQADDFQVFCYLVHDLCFPTQKRSKGRPRKTQPDDGTHAVALEAFELWESGVAGSYTAAVERVFSWFLSDEDGRPIDRHGNPIGEGGRRIKTFPVSPKPPETPRERSRWIRGATEEVAVRRLVAYMNDNFGKLEWPYSEISRDRWPSCWDDPSGNGCSYLALERPIVNRA